MVDVSEFPIINVNSKVEFIDFRKLFNIDEKKAIVIAGPCGVENFETLQCTAEFLVKLGVNFLRGGLFKPRTSPYSFQGIGRQGLKFMNEIGKFYKMVTVSEVTDVRNLDLFLQYIDVLQIGSRNMQNFELLKEVGRCKHPVVLKRGMSANIKEFILAAEYIAYEGNRKILMCERGIRTFESCTRNTWDVAAIALIKKYTKIPIIADLSHSLGRTDIVNEIAKCVLNLGADGLMVEVHPRPKEALSDKDKQLNFNEAKLLIDVINKQSC